MTESVPMRSAPMPLDMSPDVATYVGILEGTIAALVVNEAKYRWYLELLTGEAWEDTRIDMNGNVLQELAVSALIRQTGMDASKAKVLVAKRWNERNLPADQIVPQAVNVDAFANGGKSEVRPDMSERFRIWKEKQIADSENLESQVSE